MMKRIKYHLLNLAAALTATPVCGDDCDCQDPDNCCVCDYKCDDDKDGCCK